MVAETKLTKPLDNVFEAIDQPEPTPPIYPDNTLNTPLVASNLLLTVFAFKPYMPVLSIQIPVPTEALVGGVLPTAILAFVALVNVIPVPEIVLAPIVHEPTETTPADVQDIVVEAPNQPAPVEAMLTLCYLERQM